MATPGITVKVLGLQKMIADMKALSVEGSRMADAVISATADIVVSEAKQSAPADLGTIRQNIGKEKVQESVYNIFANAPESPFQEFGTGAMVNIPADFSDIAAMAKGTGTGTFADFVLSLTDWVRRHGSAYGASYSVKTHKRTGKASVNRDLDMQAAYLIARAILRRGLRPQPFLYPAIQSAWDRLPGMMQRAFDDLSFRYNNSQGSATPDSEYY